ncbi:MAG: AsmA family protein [Alphaproteobacteria bacterium]|nr:AsmA family protein [Alphaproteobacteria bacterium]
MTWIIRITTVLVVMLIIVAFLAPSFISRDMLKARLVQQIEQNTGRKLSIAGEVSVQFLPFPSVTARDVSLSGPAWQKDGEFISLESLEANVALMPLLSKRVVITRLYLNQAKINLEVSSDGQANWVMTPKSKPAKAAASKQAAPSSVLAIAFGDVRIINSAVSYHDRVKSTSYALSGLNLRFNASHLEDPVTLVADAEYNGAKTSLNLNIGSLPQLFENLSTPLTMQLENQFVNVRFDGGIDALAFKGKLTANSSSLAAAKQWLDGAAEKTAAGAPLAFELSSDVDCTLDSCIFSKLSTALDGVKALGEASYNLSGRKPQFDIKLTMNALDLSPFLAKTRAPSPSASLSITSSAHAAATSGQPSQPLDFSWLDHFDATADIQTSSLKAGAISVGESRLRAKVSNGRLSADVIDAVFYGGKATINLQLDGRMGMVENRLEFSRVQAQPFLRDALGEERLSGMLTGQASFVSAGRTSHDMMANLAGRGNLSLRDGSIRGIELLEMVRNVQTAFKPADTSPKKTDFAELAASFTVERGVLKNNDLMMKAPLLRLSGSGEINLVQSTIRYRLRPEIVETMQGQDGKDKSGIMVPILVEGSLDNPSFRPDLAAAAEEVLKDPQKIKDTVKNVKEQLKGDGLKDAVKDVKGLLKGF